MRVFHALLLAAATAALTACGATKNAVIEVKEKFGYAKREQLVTAVKDTRTEQEAAKKQFASALDEFMSVTGAKGGELEAKYNKLKKQHEASESRAQAVRDEIANTERVANALFKEWRAELTQYSSQDLRRASERQLDDTQRRFDMLLGTMKNASAKMDPVLAAFKDQVLFLKHNLNARAIASLQENAGRIQNDVATLIKEMEAAINESTAFIEQMQKEG